MYLGHKEDTLPFAIFIRPSFWAKMVEWRVSPIHNVNWRAHSTPIELKMHKTAPAQSKQ